MGVIEKYKDHVLYLEIDGFSKDHKMRHLFSTRIGWEQEGIFHGLSQILDIPEDKIYRAKQVHGIDVAIIEDQNNRSIGLLEVDGFVTNKKGISLATYHADCVPIYYYDSVKEVIGLAHAGWKGTLNNINKVVIEKMMHHYGCNIKDIQVAIGPSIGSCCYEIGQDVERLFMEKYASSDIIVKKENGIYLDLWKVNKKNLIHLGILETNIYESKFCTSCNIEHLYSYRKENGTKNRMIGAITLNS